MRTSLTGLTGLTGAPAKLWLARDWCRYSSIRPDKLVAVFTDRQYFPVRHMWRIRNPFMRHCNGLVWWDEGIGLEG